MSEIKQLNPAEAWQALQSDSAAILLDVRDPVEYAFVGHPTVAVNIPWKLAPAWMPNGDFLAQVEQLVPARETPVFMMCRSGQRSLDAAKALAAAGYTRLTNIEEGFEGPLDEQKHRSSVGGWRFRGLPWKQG